jgi:hypothetical protein
MAESLRCGDIDAMVGRRSHKIGEYSTVEVLPESGVPPTASAACRAGSVACSRWRQEWRGPNVSSRVPSGTLSGNANGGNFTAVSARWMPTVSPLASRRLAILGASQFHPAEGLDRVVACGVSARRLFDFQARGTPERAHPMYYAPYRDEFAEAIFCNRLCGVHSTRISRLGDLTNQAFPLRLARCRAWGMSLCRRREES